MGHPWNRYSVAARYATKTGRPGSRDFLVDAVDLKAAIAKAHARVGDRAKLDLHVRLIGPVPTGKET